MGFSLAALFGFGKKKVAPVRAEPAERRTPARRDIPQPVPAAVARRAPARPAPGVTGLLRQHGSAVAKRDTAAAYAAARALAATYRRYGRRGLSVRWSREAARLLELMLVAKAPARALVVRTAACAALKRAGADGRGGASHVRLLKRLCGSEGSLAFAAHRAWLGKLAAGRG